MLQKISLQRLRDAAIDTDFIQQLNASVQLCSQVHMPEIHYKGHILGPYLRGGYRNLETPEGLASANTTLLYTAKTQTSHLCAAEC